MTYVDFKAYILRALWRTGDTDFEADLDTLIKKAEARIGRDLRQNDMTKTALIITDTGDFDVPDDYAEAVSVTIGDSLSYFTPTTIQHFSSLRDNNVYGNFFTVVGKNMRLLHRVTALTPAAVNLVYYYKPVPYITDPVEPMFDVSPDFYEAAVRAQCYDYLREFELSGEYNGKYDKLLESMRDDQVRKEFPAGGIYMPLPGVVA